MMCNCIIEINDTLKQTNTELNVPFMLNDSSPRAIVSAVKRDTKNRENPMNILAIYCPFCGEKYQSNEME